MRVSLCILGVPNGFDEGAESGVSLGHVFPQGMLSDIALVGGRAGGRVVRARARCEPEHILCSVTITTLLGAGVGTKVLKQKP